MGDSCCFSFCGGGRLIFHAGRGVIGGAVSPTCSTLTLRCNYACNRVAYQLTALFISLPCRLIKRNSPPACHLLLAAILPDACWCCGTTCRGADEKSEGKKNEKQKQKKQPLDPFLQHFVINVSVLSWVFFPLCCLQCFCFFAFFIHVWTCFQRKVPLRLDYAKYLGQCFWKPALLGSLLNCSFVSVCHHPESM